MTTIKQITPAQRAKITTSRRLSTYVDRVVDAVGFNGWTLLPYFDDGEPNVHVWETVDNVVDVETFLDALEAAGMRADAQTTDHGRATVIITL